MTILTRLPTWVDDPTLNVVIETPQGSQNKFDYDEDLGVFRYGKSLPAGSRFPFDFGFVPSTRGEDGDPLDVLVLMDAAAFPGCLVVARLLGVLEAEQTERDGRTTRNDRLVAAAEKSRRYRDVRSLDQLDRTLLDEIEAFFVSYNGQDGKLFRPTGRAGAERARRTIEEAAKRAQDTLLDYS